MRKNFIIALVLTILVAGPISVFAKGNDDNNGHKLKQEIKKEIKRENKVEKRVAKIAIKMNRVMNRLHKLDNINEGSWNDFWSSFNRFLTINNLSTSSLSFRHDDGDDNENEKCEQREKNHHRTNNLIISDITTQVGTTSIAVSWLTNKPANSKVFFGISTPLDITASSTSSVANSSLVTNHSLTIFGLATSTTYRLKLESKNPAGKTATSTEFSLTTTAI
ncbi:MAG TPA: fibronectin type III domain-containing protein [Candidatus Paceibacterota bacterium]